MPAWPILSTFQQTKETNSVRILAVDPGLTRCGVAVLDAQPSRRVNLVHVSVVRTAADLDLGTRLLQIEDHVNDVADQFDADQVAIERVFSQHNVQTVIGTAQAAGVVALVAARRGLVTAFHTPSEVKAAVTGSGRADKKQVATLVAHIVGQHVPGPADATDAVALGICHAWRSPAGHMNTSARARSSAMVSDSVLVRNSDMVSDSVDIEDRVGADIDRSGIRRASR